MRKQIHTMLAGRFGGSGSVVRLCLPVFLLSLFILSGSDATGADDVLDWHAAEVRGDEKAVLVLCPGMNGNGAFFLEESKWMDFAKTHRLGVIALAFRSDPGGMYGEARQGYYWPEQGSGEALLSAIRETYGEDLPIIIYGFSGGAQFAGRFVEWMPERVIGWAAYSAQFWDAPKPHAVTPPGIVACGEHDGSRWHPSFSFFYQGRALGKPWIWVSLRDTGHVRHGAFESFVREFFEMTLMGESRDYYVDVGTCDPVADETATLQPELLAVLTSESLFKSWSAIHAP